MVAGSSNKERASAKKNIGERGRGTWRGQGQERVASDVSADGIKKTGTPPTPQKNPTSYLTPAKLIPKENNSAAKNNKADIECFHCHERGHYANACPQRTAKGEAKGVTSPESPKHIYNSPKTPAMKRSLRRSDEVPKRATLACRIGDMSNKEPTIMIQANADSFSDVNLVPEQWWPIKYYKTYSQ